MNIEIRKEAQELHSYVVNLRKHFHQHPELSLEEWETSKRIQEELTEIGVPVTPVAETGVIGLIGSGGAGDRTARGHRRPEGGRAE